MRYIFPFSLVMEEEWVSLGTRLGIRIPFIDPMRENQRIQYMSSLYIYTIFTK